MRDDRRYSVEGWRSRRRSDYTSAMTGSICAFSHWLCLEVGRELTEARKIGHQWRETTWTDLTLKHLRALRDPRIIVGPSHEVVTGADMDWWFVDRSTGRHIGLTLQAKILHYPQRDSARWAYDELPHPRKSLGAQARQLISYVNTARRSGAVIYPMYVFYNCDQGVPPDTEYPASWPGVTVANGYAIARYIQRNIVGATFPIDRKRFRLLAPYMQSLSALLCNGEGAIPRPDDVVEFLTEERERLKYFARTIELDFDARATPRPLLGDGIPAAAELLMGRYLHDGDFEDAITRNTVVFLSGD